MPEKAGVKVSMNTAADVIQWRAHTVLRWLTCMEITIFIAEVTTVFVNKNELDPWAFGLCFMASLSFKKV